jgi:hypothetical protein
MQRFYFSGGRRGGRTEKEFALNFDLFFVHVFCIHLSGKQLNSVVSTMVPDDVCPHDPTPYGFCNNPERPRCDVPSMILYGGAAVMSASTLRSADDGGTHHDVPRRLLKKKLTEARTGLYCHRHIEENLGPCIEPVAGREETWGSRLGIYIYLPGSLETAYPT